MNVHVALATPESASVSVMLHVTVCDAEVVLIADGVKLNAVSAGAAVSQSASTGVHPRPAKHKTAAKAARMPLREFMGPVLQSS